MKISIKKVPIDQTQKFILVQDFFQRQPLYEELTREVAYLLKEDLRKWGICIASISYRAKTLESFLEKINRKGYTDPLRQNTDFAGVRVVFPYLADSEAIKKIIHENFLVKKEIPKWPKGGLGYRALHYLVKLKPEKSGLRHEKMGNLICEIQIRTILQDAWAIVNNHLVYKHEKEIPKEIKKRLNNLVEQFEISDEKFNSLRNDCNNYLSQVNTLREEQFFAQPINLDTITIYLARKFSNLKPTIYGFEIHALLEDLFRKPFSKKYQTLANIEKVLSKHQKSSRKVLTKIQNNNLPILTDSGVLLLTIALGKSDKTFLKESNLIKNYANMLGWEFDRAFGFHKGAKGPLSSYMLKPVKSSKSSFPLF